MDPALIIFAALAAFLCYRLYVVLGTRGGHEPEESERPTPMAPSPTSSAQDDDPERPAPVVELKPQPEWAQTVRQHYAQFDAATFVNGAKSAYEMIVQAFANGDLSEVKPFVAPSVYEAFQTAIDSRKTAGQTMDVTFVGIDKADVQTAFPEGDTLKIVVAFQSDQVRVVRDGEGNVIDGDPNRIDLVKDVWTFTRPLRSNDPNWALSATGGAAPTTA